MKVRSPLLSVLMMGSMSVLGLSEHPSNARARAMVCLVRCEKDEVPEECRRLCYSNLREIPILDDEAEASATIVCRLADGLLVDSDHRHLIIEVRDQTSDWGFISSTDNINFEVFMDRPSSYFPYNVLPPGSHQFRITRVLAGGISKSEIKEFTVPGPDDNPANDLDIWIQCLTYEMAIGEQNATVTAHIGFRPVVKITPCVYVLICRQDQGEYSEFRAITFPGIHPQKPAFHNLPVGMNFTVTLTSTTNRDSWQQIAAKYPLARKPAGNEMDLSVIGSFKFSTLSHWSTFGAREICVPDDIEDLEAVIIHRNNTNIYDVHVTWRKPRTYIPDFFIVNITSNSEDFDGSLVSLHNESGAATEATFRGVNISKQFNVSIRGWSLLGGGLVTSRSFTVPNETIDLSAIIITAVLGSEALLVITGVCVYLMSKRRRSVKSSKRNKDEIDPDRMTITRVLGSGAFGVVKFGRLRDDNGQVIDVAVKMLRDDTNKTELRNFRLEIEMIKSLGKHPNIVSFVGYRTTGLYPILVVEYCPRGDLLTFLRLASLETKTTTVDEMDKRSVSAPELRAPDASHERNSEASEDSDMYIDAVDVNQDTNTVTVLDILNFGRQIATGMEFLSCKKIVHRDLAARNILVCDKRVVKISDFGMSRDIYRDNMYRKKGIGRMPFKWMSIESLIRQVYTTQSDVWSFGVLLWEIFTLGQTPYLDIPTLDILKLLQSGYRMERPEICSEALYNVMLSCWDAKPKNRPTFTVLRQQLDRLIRTAAEHEYLDADYVSFGMTLEEDSKPSSSRDTSPPLERSSADDL